ncbi:hypothetical protein, partial [Nocardia mangyaensis]|uniref:hypothetical protein n=1 Tax=Nocardia mangyaensis TaxID=2213200 RepID=UPI0026761ABA
GAILIRVDISSDVTATDISDAIKTACDANSSFVGDFTTIDNTGSVTFLAIKNGTCTDATVNSVVGAWALGSITQGDGFEYDTSDGGDILLSSLSSVASSIDETARSLVRAINQDSNGICYAYYLSGPEDLPGIIRLEARNLSDEAFYTGVIGSIGSKFNPTQPETVTGSSIVASTDLITTGSAHGFSVNDLIYIYNTDSTPALLGAYYIKTAPSSTTFTLSETEGGSTLDITADSSSNHGIFFATTEVTSNEENPHYLYYSKSEQPEAVPIVNFIPIGSKNSPIERIVPLRDALYVLKTEGIYQVTGTDPSNFSSFLYDDTKGIIAPDSVGVVNNQIYFLSESGVTRVSDTGTDVVSREIEDSILGVTKSGFNFRTASVGVGYETDRAYMLWLPTTSSDTTGTQSYRYNPFNDTW